MEAFRADDMSNPLRLTRLYTNAKQSYRHAIPTVAADDAPEIASLNRKFRMQKDRLIAWGLEWSDNDNASSEGPIGETIERAGLTEVVSSVMENIIQMVDEVEKMRLSSAPSTEPANYPPEKAISWDSCTVSRYADLVRDITSSLDLLCDLSRSRRSPQPSEKPKDPADDPNYPDEKRRLKKQLQAFDDPKVSHPKWIPFNSNMPAARKLDRSTLVLPEEAPPPYDSFGAACPVRFIANLRKTAGYMDSKADDPVKTVLVEYARFDGIYQSSSIPLPYSRLEQLSRILSPRFAGRPQPLLDLVGYFEDASRPRIGLVYELPDWFRATSASGGRSDPSVKPTSLFSQLQASSKSQPTASNPITVPALEDRFHLASEVVGSFAHLLDHDFTHRDLNSSSITFFPRVDADQQPRSTNSSTEQYMIRKPVLCSFDLFSEFDIDASPESINQNIYRHPDDPRLKGPGSNAVHHARFDVYSLGLVILEIGLWVPLSDIFKDKYSLKDFKLRLEKIWIPRLASKCGSAYMHAAEECLRAGNDADASAGKLKQVVRKMRARLERCCMLSEDEDTDEELSLATGDSSVMQFQDTDEADASIFDEKLASRESNVPVGAHPPVPVYPEYEISKNGARSCSRKRRAQEPVRYLFPNLQWPQPIVQEYVNLGKRICKIGERILDSRESADISMDGFGENEQTAKPTFCIMCCSTRKFAKAIKKHLDIENSPFDFIFFQGSVVRSKAMRSSTLSDVRRAAAASDIPAKNPHHYARPLCGASIGAWKNYEHLPPVSFGGVVLVDGQPYGMSVHHMLEDPENVDDQGEEGQTSAPSIGDDAVPRSSAHGADLSDAFDGMSDGFSFTASDDGESGFFSDLDLSDNEDDQDDQERPTSHSLVGDDGDTAGVKPGTGVAITITQPALADVAPDFFPVDEDKDDDHLDSHTLGHIHASSGLRRLTHGGAEHEIDWALLKLDSTRLQARNIVAGGRRFCPSTSSIRQGPDLYPVRVAPADDLAGLGVHCAGRTSGLAAGRIGQFMEFVKMAGRRSWSESWTVQPAAGSGEASKLGLPGDSGAWVIDNAEGRVCGHVLAWSERKQVAYIAPMEVMLEDIRETLGARAVGLPGQDDAPFRLHVQHPGSSALRFPGTKQRAVDTDSGLDVSADIGELTLDRDDDVGRTSSASSSSSRLYAQHMLLSGRPDHMEREWTARRSALGLQASG